MNMGELWKHSNEFNKDNIRYIYFLIAKFSHLPLISIIQLIFLSISFCIDLVNILVNMNNQDDLNRNGEPLSPSSLVAAAAALPPEAINLYAGLLSASPGSPINMLTPQIFAANQLLAARLNSTTANFYPHSLFPWQVPAIANSPPISPISSALNAKKLNNNNSHNNNNIVTTTTASIKAASAMPYDDANDLEINHNHLDANGTAAIGSKMGRGNKKGPKQTNTRKTTNARKKRNQILYQPYTNLETMPSGVISPGPLSPPTSGLSGSSPQSIASLEHQSPSPNKEAATTTTATATNARDKSFTCLTCNRSFGYKHVLQNHERTHTGEKPFACIECDKRFTRDHHLKVWQCFILLATESLAILWPTDTENKQYSSE